LKIQRRRRISNSFCGGVRELCCLLTLDTSEHGVYFEVNSSQIVTYFPFATTALHT